MELQNSRSAELAPPAPDAGDLKAGDAVNRIRRLMVGLGLAFAAVAWWRFGRAAGFGFAAGSAIAYLNFHWLKNGVTSLADRITNTGEPQSSKGIVARFLLRYVLMGAAAYAILTSFPASLAGLFAGLFLPVGAIACETAYEVYATLSRKL